MKSRLFILMIVVIAIAAIGVFLTKKRQPSPVDAKPAQTAQSQTSTVMSESRIPAHYELAPAAEQLGAVLPATRFTRAAYEAAKEIPTLLAQMPCYCHCDRGMGHKSLHSCFEDEHAAHCATCVDEALMAYRLQKQGLSPVQIRKQIITEFGD